ncbi:non-hydrolyzing UDP-N-acetylglucosamine 2-epimerase [Pseudactinotalea suaedae]|uniref:non-hydrolyzing UDP-N-acetylglucosamine 2-epimerase n=1 Tax=Pseudactinotalea suaedae TaxID=1524924 RepID=UPI0012E1F518|nr:UDP-N-acetylglucosamine 2-epimerase (non-hydrolyzing) [Pseudactinotalea suaedae]
MKILSVVGARPQFVKLAPVADAITAAGAEHVIVHTGQHYDPLLSDVFFDDLAIPSPDVHLGVGSGSHGKQTGAILAALDDVLAAHSPDWVLVYGDTNSTLAAAVSAVKMHLPLAHLEAGLRSFNRAMPEEHNRVLTDHAADLLLAPTQVALGHLRDEGLADRTVVVGDVMTDVLYRTRGRADPLPGAEEAVVATIHRAENTDDPERLAAIVAELAGLVAGGRRVLLLAHPRLRAKAAAAGIDLTAGGVEARDPLAYPALVATVAASQGVVTDSGGLQKEAFLLQVPCTTVRTETEWTETVDLGWNVLVEPGGIAAAAARPRPADVDAAPYGTGDAAERAVAALADHLPR